MIIICFGVLCSCKFVLKYCKIDIIDFRSDSNENNGFNKVINSASYEM